MPAPGFSEYARSAALFGAEICEYSVPGFDTGRSLAEMLPFAPDHKDYKTGQGPSNCSAAQDDTVYNSEPSKPCHSEPMAKTLSGDLTNSSYSGIVFVCRPNNPDGSMMSLDELRETAVSCEENGSLLAVDECFLEFTDGTSALALLDRHRNIVVINAFTKTYALAGLRLGFAFSADTALLDEIYRFGTPWSVSSAAQSAGIACCSEIGFLAESRRYVAEERKRLISAIENLGLTVFPSEANFLLIKDNRGLEVICRSGNGEETFSSEKLDVNLSGFEASEMLILREALSVRGIKVRDCRSFTGLDDSYIRIGIRTKEENIALIKALEDIYKQG